MKRLALILSFFALPAFAQSAPAPTVESVTEDANAIIQTLRSQLIAAGDRETQALAANAKLQKQLADALKQIPAKDAPKPEKTKP